MTLSILSLKRVGRLACLLSTIFFFCTPLIAKSEYESIKNTIISYNKTLIEAAKNPHFLKNFEDEHKLEKFAEKKVAQKLYIWIKSWHENNLYMNAKLQKIVFKKIEQKDDRAKVITDEKWEYTYLRHIDVNKTLQAWPSEKIDYSVRYELINKNGTWKIEKIGILSEKVLKKSRQVGSATLK